MQTIGERLEEARKKKGISIREAAEATKIRSDYLQKFESNHFDIDLAEIYTRGFLRTYANYLKLPSDRIVNDYAALGRGDVRPRQPTREVYGRMDITVATSEGAERTAPAPETAPAEPSPANRGPQRPRTGSSLPKGPDPAIVFKYVKIGGLVVIGLLVLLIVKAVFFGGDRSGSKQTAVAPRGPVITLMAVRAVQVKVSRPNPEDPERDGEVLFSGKLDAGETQVVARPGELFVEAKPRDNLDIDINGYRFNWGEKLAPHGARMERGRLQAPQ